MGFSTSDPHPSAPLCPPTKPCLSQGCQECQGGERGQKVKGGVALGKVQFSRSSQPHRSGIGMLLAQQVLLGRADREGLKEKSWFRQREGVLAGRSGGRGRELLGVWQGPLGDIGSGPE